MSNLNIYLEKKTIYTNTTCKSNDVFDLDSVSWLNLKCVPTVL